MECGLLYCLAYAAELVGRPLNASGVAAYCINGGSSTGKRLSGAGSQRASKPFRPWQRRWRSYIGFGVGDIRGRFCGLGKRFGIPVLPRSADALRCQGGRNVLVKKPDSRFFLAFRGE